MSKKILDQLSASTNKFRASIQKEFAALRKEVFFDISFGFRSAELGNDFCIFVFVKPDRDVSMLPKEWEDFPIVIQERLVEKQTMFADYIVNEKGIFIVK